MADAGPSGPRDRSRDVDRIEDLLRPLVPQVLGALVRRFGHFDVADDAVQDALVAASMQWPADGVPDRPRAWLITVASRRMVDRLRSDSSRRRREEGLATTATSGPFASAADEPEEADEGRAGDDTLALLFLCAHPAVSAPSQLALTLRAVGGLTTAEIARAFFVPESTMAQRITRAKQSIRAAGARFTAPVGDERSERLTVVLHVLYLIFNEGYATSSGEDLLRTDLTVEAIRLARLLVALTPHDPEASGLLALMLLTDARRGARTTGDGSLVPLAEQDRSRWDVTMIAEGVELVTTALSAHRPGPYQLQAAIAAVHDEAESFDATDWPQVVALYDVLAQIEPNPMAMLNRAVAVGMAEGPTEGLAALAPLEADDRMADHHRLHAVRAHLHELAGDLDAARAGYREAARRTTSRPERRYLEARAARLS